MVQTRRLIWGNSSAPCYDFFFHAGHGLSLEGEVSFTDWLTTLRWNMNWTSKELYNDPEINSEEVSPFEVYTELPQRATSHRDPVSHRNRTWTQSDVAMMWELFFLQLASGYLLLAAASEVTSDTCFVLEVFDLHKQISADVYLHYAAGIAKCSRCSAQSDTNSAFQTSHIYPGVWFLVRKLALH